MSELSLDALSTEARARLSNFQNSPQSKLPSSDRLSADIPISVAHILDGSTEDRSISPPNVSTCAAEHRTREQCRLSMMRFHPACDLNKVLAMLEQSGFTTDQRDGTIWIRLGVKT